MCQGFTGTTLCRAWSSWPICEGRAPFSCISQTPRIASCCPSLGLGPGSWCLSSLVFVHNDLWSMVGPWLYVTPCEWKFPFRFSRQKKSATLLWLYLHSIVTANYGNKIHIKTPFTMRYLSQAGLFAVSLYVDTCSLRNLLNGPPNKLYSPQ